MKRKNIIPIIAWILTTIPIITTYIFFSQPHPDAGSQPHFYIVNLSVLIPTIALTGLENIATNETLTKHRKYTLTVFFISSIYIPFMGVIPKLGFLGMLIMGLTLPLLFLSFFIISFFGVVVLFMSVRGSQPESLSLRLCTVFVALVSSYWNFWFIANLT